MRIACFLTGSILASFFTTEEARAGNCVVSFLQLYLTPQAVEFHEDSAGGKLTLFDTAISESIVFQLDRQVLTEEGSLEKISVLLGTETVKSGKLVNELQVVVPDKTFPSGNRNFSIKSTVLIEGYAPQEDTLSGILRCPG